MTCGSAWGGRQYIYIVQSDGFNTHTSHKKLGSHGESYFYEVGFDFTLANFL